MPSAGGKQSIYLECCQLLVHWDLTLRPIIPEPACHSAIKDNKLLVFGSMHFKNTPC